jgi:hypothetical protein
VSRLEPVCRKCRGRILPYLWFWQSAVRNGTVKLRQMAAIQKSHQIRRAELEGVADLFHLRRRKDA